MKFSTICLSLCICGVGTALSADNPPTTPRKPSTTRVTADDSGHRAAADTAAAIEALGAQPSNRQISSIVFEAVRKSPDNVLLIVDAAVRVSPQSASRSIVTAATAAVPDPWKQVSYHRIESRLKKGSRDYKGGHDGKGSVNLDGQTSDPGSPGRGAVPFTLAEAIARTAFDARPGLSLAELQSAVDVALNTDPATLLRNIQSARTLSGVGDAGSSNIANEPLRARVVAGTPVPVPNPPVVSR